MRSTHDTQSARLSTSPHVAAPGNRPLRSNNYRRHLPASAPRPPAGTTERGRARPLALVLLTGTLLALLLVLVTLMPATSRWLPDELRYRIGPPLQARLQPVLQPLQRQWALRHRLHIGSLYPFGHGYPAGACRSLGPGLQACAASDLARPARDDAIKLDHPDYRIGEHPLRLRAAANETVAFQLILRNTSGASGVVSVSTEISPRPENADAIQLDWYQAHYHTVAPGGYTWGPRSSVRRWPADYPDALIPQSGKCGDSAYRHFEAVAVPAENENLALWFDLYVPHTMPAGTRQINITLQHFADNTDHRDNIASIDIPVDIEVFPVQLPQQPSLQAVGEIYRSYRLEGAGETPFTNAWTRMSQCYQQLAHQHRMVFQERFATPIRTGQHTDFLRNYASTLDGSLFTAQHGYRGTGTDTPVAVWRTPWPQQYDISLKAPLPEAELALVQELAQEWGQLSQSQQWQQTRFFAYLFDEVDGPPSRLQASDTDVEQHRRYIEMVHQQMRRVQNALDAGVAASSASLKPATTPDVGSSGGVASNTPIDLLWTSHANPSQWQFDEALDLRGIIRLWSPNASAADPDFLAGRIAAGEHAWIYHSGHPAIGAHSINAAGVDMRTWGVIAARYGLQGNLMWAVNLGIDDAPFATPSYKTDDDRFGNGVLIYPGNQLARIGFNPAPGPLPSMRLKTWRRGLQDAELYLLAQRNDAEAAQALIEKLVPIALAEAEGAASWPTEPAAWIDFHLQLLQLASGTASTSP